MDKDTMSTGSQSQTSTKTFLSVSSLKREFASGFIAGSITSIIVHPFDLIKLRLQLNAGTLQGSKSSWSKVYHELTRSSASSSSSPLKSLYRGVSINVLGNSIAWALYFGLYRWNKDQLSNCHILSNNNTLIYLMSGTLAGMTTSLITNPIWILKTRIMSLNKDQTVKYANIRSSIKNLILLNGWKSLKIGLIPAMMGVSQGALYFMVYDNLKNWLGITREKKLKPLEIITITSISKMISMSLVYPLQLIKSNQQSIKATKNNNYKSMRTLIPFIIKQNGVKGLYKGLATNICKAIPSTCITFYIYETVNNL